MIKITQSEISKLDPNTIQVIWNHISKLCLENYKTDIVGSQKDMAYRSLMGDLSGLMENIKTLKKSNTN